jgi:Domain of unknown function (DUF3394)
VGRDGRTAGKAGRSFDVEITSVPGVEDRPSKELMRLPAPVVPAMIAWLQRRRSPTLAPATAAVAAAGD